MTGRFTDLPDRLRRAAEIIGSGDPLDLTDEIAISSLLGDAALKIEALERDLVPRSPRRGRCIVHKAGCPGTGSGCRDELAS